MSTPPYIVPSADVDDIFCKLEREQARQRAVDRQATPEAVFRTDAKHSYKLECELLHAKYEDEKIDEIRLGIADSKYWQTDANFAARYFFNALCNRYTADGVTDFRSISIEFRRLLEEQGQSSQQFRQQRDTMTDERYWEKEAQHFKLESARREFQRREKLRSDIQAIPNPAHSESNDGSQRLSLEISHFRATTPSDLCH